jgi:two-component system chemotaxis response regulator CheY
LRILLVDDSLTIRSLLRRTLAEMLSAEIVEAANGVEALAQLVRRRFDLVVLDVNMPVMDGLETLEAIRTTADYAGLPVVMLTSEKSEALVRRLVELGITAYLSKPLSQDVLTERLSKILERLREPAASRQAEQAPGRRMLIVEQDPDRRHFLMNAVTGHYTPVEADSAAAALQLCHGASAPSFDFVLVGQNVGLPPVEMFLPKLKALPQMAGARVVGCVRRGETVPEHRRRLFEALLEGGSVPEVFLADLDRALTGTQTALARILLVRPTLARDLICATEQVFGMMLSSEVEASMAPPRRAPRAGRPGVHASIGLITEGDAVLTLLFRADPESARNMAARLIGVPPAEVQDADVLASAAELSNIVLGRLRNRLVETGMRAQMQLPRTWSGEADATGKDDPHAIDVSFHAPDIEVSCDLLLCASAAAEAAA